MAGKEATAQEDEADAEGITAFPCRRDLEGRGISASSAINTIGAGGSTGVAEMVEDEVEDEDEEEADDGLLAEVEDEEDDVAGIIDPGIAKDEA